MAKAGVTAKRPNTTVIVRDRWNCRIHVTAHGQAADTQVRLAARAGTQFVPVDLSLEHAEQFARALLRLVSELQGHGENAAVPGPAAQFLVQRADQGISRGPHPTSR